MDVHTYTKTKELKLDSEGVYKARLVGKKSLFLICIFLNHEARFYFLAQLEQQSF